MLTIMAIVFVPGIALCAIVSPPLNISVGESFMLTCSSESDEPVVWYHRRSATSKSNTVCENGKFLNGYGSTFQLVTTESRIHVLKVAHARLNLSGIYECVEESGYGTHRQFEVNIRRRNFSVSQPIVATVGDRVLIECVTGVDDAVVWQYYRNADDRFTLLTLGKSIRNAYSKNFSLEMTDYGDNNLIIKRADLSNSGSYECIEAQGEGPGRGKVSLIVKMRTSASVIVAERGHPVVLTCATGLLDQPSWIFYPAQLGMPVVISVNGSLVDEYRNETKFMVTSPVSGVYRLQVTKIDVKDEGTYRCLVGTVSSALNEANISLIVSVSKKSSPVVATIGEDKRLACTSENNTGIEWTFCADDGRPCKELHNKLFNKLGEITDVELVLSNVSSSDGGYYICTDDYGFGKQRASVKLSVNSNKDTDTVTTSNNALAFGTGVVLGVVAVAVAIIWIVCKKRIRRKQCLPKEQPSPNTAPQNNQATIAFTSSDTSDSSSGSSSDGSEDYKTGLLVQRAAEKA